MYGYGTKVHTRQFFFFFVVAMELKDEIYYHKISTRKLYSFICLFIYSDLKMWNLKKTCESLQWIFSRHMNQI